MFTFQPSLLSLVLLSALGLFVVVQWLYHFKYFKQLGNHQPDDVVGHFHLPVSIIVCTRSEIENLKLLMPVLLNQDYPNYEIIVVDDASWDGSTTYLEELAEQESKLKVVYINEDMKKNYLGKKLALSLGIKAAKNEILLLTDSDCLPLSNQWVKQMVSVYHTRPEIEIVLGFSPFRKKNTVVNLISRMDTAYTGLSYLSYALAGDPYMGVGRNLSYKRSLFFKQKGFATHLHIAPGDDDLFVNQAGNAQNTAICVHPDAFVQTLAKTSFSAWFRQKKRHNFAGKYYRFKHQVKLGFFAFSHAMLWLVFIANCFIYESMGWALILILLFWLVKWPVIYSGFKKLKQKGIVLWMPLFDILYLFYNSVFGIIALFGKQKKW